MDQRGQERNRSFTPFTMRESASSGQTGATVGTQAAQSAHFKNMLIVQEMIGRVRNMLRDPGFGPNSDRLSMDFQSNSFGQMKLSMTQSEGTLSVSMQVSDDSSRQQLLGHRDELAQQLRDLGYKDVSLNVNLSSEENQDEDGRSNNKTHGNEVLENVKLAGDAEKDLAEAVSA